MTFTKTPRRGHRKNWGIFQCLTNTALVIMFIISSASNAYANEEQITEDMQTLERCLTLANDDVFRRDNSDLREGVLLQLGIKPKTTPEKWLRNSDKRKESCIGLISTICFDSVDHLTLDTGNMCNEREIRAWEARLKVTHENTIKLSKERKLPQNGIMQLQNMLKNDKNAILSLQNGTVKLHILAIYAIHLDETHKIGMTNNNR